MKQREDEYYLPPGQAHWTLFLLFVLMAFDFIDRQVLSALLPSIKAEWSLSDTQLGLTVSIVNIAIAVLALPTAIIVDRWSRTRAIGGMAVLWSLATGACALATNYYQMLAARFLVGAGEAGYAAGGNALLGTLYPERLRSTVIGIFQSAGALGAVIGVVLGGIIAARWGWRAAFGIVAIPGLIFAILVFFLKDYKTLPVTVRDTATGAEREASWPETVLMVLRTPVLLVLFLGEAAQLFFVSTLVNWLPSFFNRVHAIPVDQAGLRTGIALIVSAIGVALGGLAADRIAGKHAGRRLTVCAIYALASAVLFVLAFRSETAGTQFLLILAGALFMNAVLAPVFATVMDLVHPGMSSSAMGILVTFNNLFGMALGPVLGGMLSDRYDLQTSLLINACIPVFAAACIGYAARQVGRS